MTKRLHRFHIPTAATSTTVLSMVLVLALAGTMIVMAVVASRLVTRLQASATVTLSIANNVMPPQLDSLESAITALPQVANTHVTTRSEALEQWKQETGEDLVELLGENPLNSSIKVAVKPQWASPDSLVKVKQHLEQLSGVIDATSSTRDMDNIVHNARSAMTTLAVALMVMLIIAVVLIVSMVRLLTYSQRFHIHTMTLVGATTWFIVKPYMWRGIAMGLVAAIIATALLAGVWQAMAHSTDPLVTMLSHSIYWKDIALTAAIIAMVGGTVAGTATSLAARRYTRITHNQLFV